MPSACRSLLIATVSLSAMSRARIEPGAAAGDGRIVESDSSDATVLARFLARPDEPTRSFRARRHLEIRAPFGRSAWLDVEVELSAEGFRYSVLDEGGSQMLRNKVLLDVLRSERELYAHGDSPRTALTVANYSLTADGHDAHGLVRLLATARRSDPRLVNGQFLVTPDSADIVLVSGTLARAPAFWVPRVDVSRRYQRIHGHRVNVEIDSVAHIRLLGTSHFRMTTRYESIDGEDVEAGSGAGVQ